MLSVNCGTFALASLIIRGHFVLFIIIRSYRSSSVNIFRSRIQFKSMTLQNFSKAWEAYTGSFPIDDYHFIPTNQLPYQSQVWYSGPEPTDQHSEPPEQQLTGQHPEPTEQQPTKQHPESTGQQLIKQHLELTKQQLEVKQPNDNLYLSSGDEADFAMDIN